MPPPPALVVPRSGNARPLPVPSQKRRGQGRQREDGGMRACVPLCVPCAASPPGLVPILPVTPS
eukprot:704066-Heterocapsa_arctica.AAC.1